MPGFSSAAALVRSTSAVCRSLRSRSSVSSADIGLYRTLRSLLSRQPAPCRSINLSRKYRPKILLHISRQAPSLLIILDGACIAFLKWSISAAWVVVFDRPLMTPSSIKASLRERKHGFAAKVTRLQALLRNGSPRSHFSLDRLGEARGMFDLLQNSVERMSAVIGDSLMLAGETAQEPTTSPHTLPRDDPIYRTTQH